MGSDQDTDRLVQILRATTVALVAGRRPDLRARQLAVFLLCYVDKGPHTARGLATHLKLSSAAIWWALERLAEHKLVARSLEPGDRRSIQVARTAEGMAFLGELRAIMDKASALCDSSVSRSSASAVASFLCCMGCFRMAFFFSS